MDLSTATGVFYRQALHEGTIQQQLAGESAEQEATEPEEKPGTREIGTPQTGDNGNLALWFALMGVGAAGFGASVLLQKRRRSGV